MSEFIIENFILKKYCGNKPSVTIPAWVTGISNSAFFNCRTLVTVDIPDSVTYIGDMAFYQCGALREIRFPDSVTSIGYQAFWGCASLTDITISASMLHVGGSAFGNCQKLKSINVDTANKRFKSIDGVLYTGYCEKLVTYPCGKPDTSFTVPDGVTDIGNGAFCGCTALSEINLPPSLLEIGYGSFMGCTALRKISIPRGVTSIYELAFEGCTSLETADIPDTVITIGTYAFSGCSSLNDVTVPPSVEHLGDGVFAKCTSLTRFTLPKNLPIRTMHVGNFTISDGLLLKYLGSDPTVVVPNSIQVIGAYAFNHNNSITDVYICDGVVSIGKSAFGNCRNLRSVTIPDSVTHIGELAFYGAPINAPLNIRFKFIGSLEEKDTECAWAGAVLGFISRYYSGRIDEKEAAEWRKYLGRYTKKLFRLLRDEPMLYHYLTDNRVISPNRINSLLENTTDPQCRAILLEYGNRGKKRTSAEDIIADRFELQ